MTDAKMTDEQLRGQIAGLRKNAAEDRQVRHPAYHEQARQAEQRADELELELQRRERHAARPWWRRKLIEIGLIRG